MKGNTDQKPVELPERNYREEAIAAAARVCAGDVRLVRNAANRGARDIYGFAVEECAARLESESRMAELTRQVESLQQERDDFREGFRHQTKGIRALVNSLRVEIGEQR